MSLRAIMNDLINSTRKHDRNKAINNCDAAAMRNSPPDIAAGNALCSEPTMPKIEIPAAACRACFLYRSAVAITPAIASANPNPLGISAVGLARPVRIQLNEPSMISAVANQMVVFDMVTSVLGAHQRYSHFDFKTLSG